MKRRHLLKTVGSALAASGAVIQTSAALAQPANPQPNSQQAAPVQTASTDPNLAPSASRAQAAEQSYADQYARWAAANCVDQRTGAVGAGAGGQRAGAPAFVYEGPYAPAVVYGPGWRQPWVWVDDHWVYAPYPPAYWGPVYWRGAWVGRPWVIRHRP